ncbi:MAG TPA: tetratricopeptide repeat protein [Bacteriovoracaceae bacterium]|nr:tetratricopeptide repeat protein [Bacteriovoracaceae bacterium]
MLNQYRYQSGQFAVSFYCFKLTGTDVFTFLQSQSTCDVKLLPRGTFHLAAFLDPHGRTECFGWLLNQGDNFLYHVPVLMKDAAHERLNRFLISEDVEVHAPSLSDLWVVLGAKAEGPENSFLGTMFDEKAWMFKYGPIPVAPLVPDEEVNVWRGLTGWPKFDGSGVGKEIINNQRIYDLAVAPNKGCYPGQETVSKIATRRGAAYAPVLLEVNKPLAAGELSNFDKKIGTAGECFIWDGKYYLEASLLRDFRVEKMKVAFNLNGSSETGVVCYYPLISGTVRAKAEELFWQATEFFKKDNFESAEKCLRMAIELDPTYADAYESLGVMLGRLERFNEAITLMEQLSLVDPDSVLAHTNMSLYLMRLGKIDEAEDQKSKATLKSFKHFGNEAKLKEETERLKKAQQEEWIKRESMFLQVLEIDDEDTLANYGLGSIAVEKGEWERARGHLEKVIKADPRYSVAYLALGKAYQALGLKDDARKIWNEGIKVAAAKGDLMPANSMHSELERL